MGDVVGRLFREFAITLAVTIVISAVVSLTLVPMMCAKLLRHRPEAAAQPLRPARRSAASTGSIGRYDRALNWVLDHQPLTLLVAVVTLALTRRALHRHPEGLLPGAGHRRDPGHFGRRRRPSSYAAMARAPAGAGRRRS